MLIVGELINSTRKAIATAIAEKDTLKIQQMTQDQHENGAQFIDVNAGTFMEEETENLTWLVGQVQEILDVPCCIDSTNAEAVEAALKRHQGTAMINSISLEKNRFDQFIPLIAGTDLKIVALCVSDEGMPETAEERVRIADKLINTLVQRNIPLENIYVDPLVQPIATKSEFGLEFLKAIKTIMLTYEGIHTICGLSNISFGLPERKFLNQTFMVMAITEGLDSAILNPLDKRMMTDITAAEALIGRDNYCMNYLKAYRSGMFSFDKAFS